jgi:large subunit ribosomal protein L24
MPIQISNIAFQDPKTNKASRVGFKFLDDGKKIRFLKKSGETIS